VTGRNKEVKKVRKENIKEINTMYTEINRQQKRKERNAEK
jgi:hypothetical protein